MNPFKTENPFKEETMRARLKREEEEYLEELDAAARVDPENKHGQWPERKSYDNLSHHVEWVT